MNIFMKLFLTSIVSTILTYISHESFQDDMPDWLLNTNVIAFWASLVGIVVFFLLWVWV